MRFQELQLTKYGPFTDTVLKLEGIDCIHIICGPNEAGKSSALRALRALLYGIPTKTTDNFVHDYRDLRIGAVLLGDDKPIHIVRKKGIKGTLLDYESRVLPDDLLEALLNGVDEEQFDNMFGIDHRRLVDGGEEILNGRGSVSAAMFAAGTGIAGARTLLGQLDEEASGLFSPAARAKNPRINEGLARLKELRSQSRQAMLRPEAWESEVRRHDHAQERMAQLRKGAAELAACIEALKRITAALPRLGEWDDVSQALTVLDDAVLLRQDFRSQRVEIDRELARTMERAELARSEIQNLKEQIEGIQVPDELLAQTALVDEIYQQLGAVAGARRDLPERERELNQATEAARRELHTIQLALDLGEADRFRLSDAQRLHVSSLSNDHKAMVNAQIAATARVEELSLQIEEVEAKLANEQDLRDAAGLRAAVQTVQEGGDMETLRNNARKELIRLSDEAAAKLSALPLWQGTLEQLEALAVPQLETISRFTSHFNQLDQRRTSQQNELTRTDEEIRKHEGAIADLRHGGQVPSEADVGLTRTRRDEGWRLVRRAWLDAEDVTTEAQSLVGELAPGGRLPEAYEEGVRVADRTVDRLRGETDRVARLSTLQAALDESYQRRERIQVGLGELANERIRAEEDWCAAWTATDIKPLPPAEMREWMGRLSILVSSAAAVRVRRTDVEELDGQIRQFHDLLTARLRELGAPQPPADQPLGAVVVQCDNVAKNIEERARAVGQLQRDLARYQRELRRAKETATAAANRLDTWQAIWTEAVKPLGLTANASPAEVSARLEAIKRLFDEMRNANESRGRIRQMKAYLDEFERRVGTLVAQVAPDLRDVPTDQAVGAINRRCQAAGEQQRKLGDLEKRLTEQSDALRQAEIAIKGRRQELDSLCQEAHCSDSRELPEAERRSDEKRRLSEKQEALRVTLLLHAGRAPLDEFLANLREAQPADVARQIDEQQQRLQKAQEDIEQCRNEVANANAELGKMDGSSAAADLLQEAHSIAARIQPEVEHYARICFAADILRQAMERYRQQNQDPILRRAGELFAVLTVQSFVRLEADVDDKDQPVLLGIRPNGKRLKVDGMSTGTRDQLYLALRLASLERYVEKGHALPFIVDDVIVNFDDQRAKATLGVLADLASKTQIIFFTHHKHLVDLAKSSLPAGKVRVAAFGT